ncbi:unnamed protein product [Effrenium voratum]|uniref:Uncharacterized protein n=1 Tax=Effrenium voratum TaxID=2562239 RepID=A0AA36MIY7_9DINO|nr:unnamed protein product [Effrenium voratum]
MPLPEIRSSPVLGRQAKAQFLKEVYDVTFSGRENVWKVVEKEKRDAKPEKVPDWMRERRRAEERAEKKWSKKFQEWQMSFEAAQDAPEEIQRMPSYREVEKLDSSAKGREEVQKAQREAQELRRECTRLEAELSRLYEEFRRVRREGMEESKRREKLEQHLETVAKDHEAWRERSEHRESQLQQARLLRRSVASRVALFGYELHDLSLRAAGTLSQAAADKGEEPPEDEVEEEADALLDAAAVNEEIARFLEQEPMPDDLIEEPVPADGPRDEEASPAVSPQHGEDSREGQVEEPVPADGPRDEEPDSPGHDWHPDSEEDSPAVSPQHGEDSREWQVEEPVPADGPRDEHGEDSREGQVEEPVPADGPRDEEPDSPGHDWHPDSEEASPAVSPQHGEDSREGQVEEPVTADGPRDEASRADCAQNGVEVVQEPSPSVEADTEVAEALLRHAELAEVTSRPASPQHGEDSRERQVEEASRPVSPQYGGDVVQEPSPSVEADAEVAEALLRHAELAEVTSRPASPQHGQDSREGQVEEPDSPGHDWHPDSEEASRPVSPQYGGEVVQEPSPSVEADAEVAEALLRHAELAEVTSRPASPQHGDG